MRVAAAGSRGLIGEGLGVDVDDGGTHVFGDPDELVGGDRGVDDVERGGVGAVTLSFLPADTVSGEGTGHNGGRQGCKQDKDGSETAVAKPFKERIHVFYNLFSITSDWLECVDCTKYQYSDCRMDWTQLKRRWDTVPPISSAAADEMDGAPDADGG